ncbi:MAG: hypothetical protein F6J90_11155 [Moorea sp. SIOASIH]|uniref:hypothetical protein n=1 Tax=Moorena sp. SIOASIH TaxID=2607817 RepID=UPI0013B75EC5|nr:hypothetical protein [Moorena sp. SIOASIH]NEO36834.1 hypothetical protein [Moorena sp. SIOASIH]NEO91432.1 hypothetical protein [Moorena sp. SIO3G5]
MLPTPCSLLGASNFCCLTWWCVTGRAILTLAVERKIRATPSLTHPTPLPTPDSRLPTPDSRLPIPYSLFPVPCFRCYKLCLLL